MSAALRFGYKTFRFNFIVKEYPKRLAAVKNEMFFLL